MIDTEKNVMDKNAVKNSLGTLRTFLFEEMVKIRNGEADLSESAAIGKLSHQVIESYKAEISAVAVANGLKDRNISFKENLKALE